MIKFEHERTTFRVITFFHSEKREKFNDRQSKQRSVCKPYCVLVLTILTSKDVISNIYHHPLELKFFLFTYSDYAYTMLIDCESKKSHTKRITFWVITFFHSKKREKFNDRQSKQRLVCTRK